jgi:hypothetical protein
MLPGTTKEGSGKTLCTVPVVKPLPELGQAGYTRIHRMLEELEVLKIVSERLESARLPFMLTGSFAMAYYGRPRMTRDLIVRKGSEYRQVEFARRQPVELNGVKTWIVSREDLILSKLVWAKDSGSELQRRDVRTLLDDSMDRAYLQRWAARLDVAEALAEIAQ